jgi:hypothetical protein
MTQAGQPDGDSVIPLGPAEHLGPVPDADLQERPRRRRWRIVVAGVVALVVLAGAGGVLLHLRSTPQWQVMSAAQATLGSSGTARVTMTGTGEDEVAYDIAWQHDPEAYSAAVVRTGTGEDAAWVQVVSADGHLYARTDVWAKHMLSRGSDELLPGLPYLPSGKVADAIVAGSWIELTSTSVELPLAGVDPGFVSDPDVRADLARLRDLAEDAVRGHSTVESEGSDERGDRYHVVVDLKQAVLDKASDLQPLLEDLAKRFASSTDAGRDATVPDFDVRDSARDLQPLPLTVWVRDGQLVGLRAAAADLSGGAQSKGALDIAFGPADQPLVPEDAVQATQQDLEDLATAAFGFGIATTSSGGTPTFPASSARFRDDQGQVWTRLAKGVLISEGATKGGQAGMATKSNGQWRTEDGRVLHLTPIS